MLFIHTQCAVLYRHNTVPYTYKYKKRMRLNAGGVGRGAGNSKRLLRRYSTARRGPYVLYNTPICTV
jgi:hypothetical protein